MADEGTADPELSRFAELQQQKVCKIEILIHKIHTDAYIHAIINHHS